MSVLPRAWILLRDAFAPPWPIPPVQLIWTDPPMAAKTPKKRLELCAAWVPHLTPTGTIISLLPDDQSDRSQAQIAESILSFTKPGDLVVDPFCGTGTTGVVALRLGRRFYGGDTDPDMIRRSAARLRTGIDPG